MATERLMIRINQENCTKCGKCARVCPADVLCQRDRGGAIEVENRASCIACGHCVDVCPTSSVEHSFFPPERIHPIDYTHLPTPEQVLLLIKSRRSNRTLTSKPIPDAALQQIVEAAYYAPTASNNQQVGITVIASDEVLKQTTRLTINTFDAAIKLLNFPLIRCLLKPFLKEIYASIPAFHRYKHQYQSGGDPILRRATALIIFHTPKSSELGCQDANLAYQNASLMAQSLGVSQIYMGFVMRAIKLGKRKELSNLFGVNGNIHAIMALGMPAFKYARYTERGSEPAVRH